MMRIIPNRKFVLLCFLTFTTSCGTNIDDIFCPGLECSSSAIVYATFFSDNFNRANGGVGASYTVGGDGGTTLDILSNEVRLGRNFISGDTPRALHSTSLSEENTRVTINFRIGGTLAAGNGFLGIFGRAQTASLINVYVCEMNTVDGRIALQKFNAGVPTILDNPTTAAPLNNGDIYQMALTLEGNKISCNVTGSTTISASAIDSDFSSGFHGFTGGIENAIEIFADDLLIETGS